MSSRAVDPLNEVTLERFREIAEAWRAGTAEDPAVYSLTLKKVVGPVPVVVGGVGRMVRATENIRIPSQLIAKLRGTGEFSEPFLDFLRPLRFTLDIFAVSEGEIVFPGTPALQIYGRHVDCLLFADFARACVEAGTRAVSLAYWCRREAKGLALYFEPAETATPEVSQYSANGCRIAGWVGAASRDASALSGLKFADEPSSSIASVADLSDYLEERAVLASSERNRTFLKIDQKETFEAVVSAPNLAEMGVGGLVLDPNNVLGADDSIDWDQKLALRSGSAQPSALQVARVFCDQGDAEGDFVNRAGEPMPAGARPMLERYTDRGRTCRPLPEPARSAVLLARAEEELCAIGNAYSEYPIKWSSVALATMAQE